MTDAEPAAEATRPPLNKAQREIVDAALAADAGLFVQASVPGSGKTYASSRLCAEWLLERAADGVDCPAMGLAVMAFNRDAAANLQPEVTDWLRYLVATDATPAARSLEAADVSHLVSAFRRSETVGTVDALLARVFRDIAPELGFDDPTVEAGHAVERLHHDAFEAVRTDSSLSGALERLSDAYPSTSDGSDELDTVAAMLQTITKRARDNGWTPSEVKKRLHESRQAFYPDGPPSSLADVIDDARRFAGDDAGVSPTKTWPDDEIVAADRALHDAWEARIDDLATVYRLYIDAYDRACREQDVVSHADCAYWVRQYFGDRACARRWADDAVSDAVIERRRTRLRERWQSRIELLVIDEAQDLSIGQHDALAQLVTDDTRVVLYGDPFQSIYTWRNAQPSLFTSAITDGTYFGREWDTHVDATAETTYRQRPGLTATVNSVFGPALEDPARGAAPTLDLEYAQLSSARDATDDPCLHLPTYRSNHINPDDDTAARDAVLAKYLRGALDAGVFDDSAPAAGPDAAVASSATDCSDTDTDHQPPVHVLFRSRTRMDDVREALTDVDLTVGQPVPVFEQPLAQTIVSVLEWLGDPLTADAPAALYDAAAAAGEDDDTEHEVLRAVADYLDTVERIPPAPADATSLASDAADLFTALRPLATDTAERARSSPAALIDRVCRILAVDEDPFGIQPDSTARRRRRICDELQAVATDADGPDTSSAAVIDVLTALCDTPTDGPSLPVNPDDYDVVFETIHSFKGAESGVVALGDPGFDLLAPKNWCPKTIIARGTMLAVCPPAPTDPAVPADVEQVPVAGYDGGLFDYEPSLERTNDAGLRWVTTRSRADSQVPFVGPERFARCVADERAEHWRLGYVAATRAREHLVVPVARQSTLDPSDSCAAAFAEVFDPTGADIPDTVTRHPSAAERAISVSIDDVAARDPATALGSWTGRSPSPPQLATYNSTAQDWLPRFVEASTFFPLSEDHDQYVVDHFLGRQLDTDSGTTDTDAPLGIVGPGVLGQIAHDTFGSLIRSDPDCDRVRAGHADITNHVDWALDRARFEHGLDDTQRVRVRDYLVESALPRFIETDAFKRLCRADTVFVEEPLETRIRVDSLRVEFRGQADFVARDGDEWLIEDIKLTFGEGSDETDDRYRHQLAAYRWILERQGVDPSAQVVARITNIGERNDESELSPETDVDELIRERLRRLGPE